MKIGSETVKEMKPGLHRMAGRVRFSTVTPSKIGRANAQGSLRSAFGGTRGSSKAAASYQVEDTPVQDDTDQAGQDGDHGGSSTAASDRRAARCRGRQKGQSDGREQDRRGTIAKAQLEHGALAAI